MMTPALPQQWWEYMVDGAQRGVLFADAMRERGNHFVEHEEGSNKTVLSWEHEMVVDGSKLARPVNYSLVRITPPEGVTVREDGRPYIIIDPRAGHGSGIGGFKHESEVGAAIHGGHPTYFVTFTRMPMPGQTWPMSPRPRRTSCARCAGCIRTRPSRSSSATARAAGPPCCSPPPTRTSRAPSSPTARR
jgi:hypothetical protein